jgi:5-methylcytosine-specific restriction endonuclease McrA
VDAVLRKFVVERAENRCKYCRIHQNVESFFHFHVEHIVARQHGGLSIETNLALACYHCNLHKGPNLSAIDPNDGQVVRLFHPRKDRWEEYFQIRESRVFGRTAIGRATAVLPAMNYLPRIELRSMSQR